MKSFLATLFAVVLPLLLFNVHASWSADWAQFRGPSGQGTSDDSDVPIEWSDTKNIVWKTKMPGPGASSPIIVKDRIFITAYSGYDLNRSSGGDTSKLVRHVICLHREDGERIWEKKIPAKQPEQPTIREGHGYSTSTPVADDERLYVFFGKSGVFAFDFEGNQIWEASVGTTLNGWGSAASPMLFQDFLIVNASVESQSIVALNKKTGDEVWRTEGIEDSWNTPLLVETQEGNTELVVAKFGQVLGIDPTTGKQLWSCETDIPWYMVPSLVAEDGIVYCIGGRNGGGSLAVRTGGRGDVTKTHRIWKGRKGSNVPSPIYHDGYLYWTHDEIGIAYCAEAKTGKLVYEERLAEGRIYASMVKAGENLYCLSRDGRAFVLGARPKFELLATNQLEERGSFDATPAIADNRLYIRSNEYLYCIGN